MITVNAIGDTCPIPVVKTKKAIEALTQPDTVETLVDNEIAVENLKKMAAQKPMWWKRSNPPTIWPRPELFGAGSPTYSGGTTGSIGTGGGTGGSGGGFKYDIPSEALSDEKFARMIEEAEKYLGMPYVWGGSSPSIPDWLGRPSGTESIHAVRSKSFESGKNLHSLRMPAADSAPPNLYSGYSPLWTRH